MQSINTNTNYITKEKSELINLYIKPEHYCTDYNFYNYHKFKTTGVVNIIYKTPSIFLNGIYFEMPYAQIIEVKKKPNASSFQMKICLANDDTSEFRVIQSLFRNIDDFNARFFSDNASKFEIKTKQTNKNGQYIKRILHGDELIEVNTNPLQSRFKNPFLKKYEYNSFITTDTNKNKYINVEIKYVYMLKICELIKANQNLLSTELNIRLNTFTDSVIKFISQEFFEFRKCEYTYNLQQEQTDLNMKFWIKSNSINANFNGLDMIWKVCAYQL